MVLSLENIEKTALWRRTLAAQEDDKFSVQREKLRASFVEMRELVSQLVPAIAADCPGLTIHDVTHLDALWEMADVVCGSDYELTPTEGYVFGAAVLLHDTAQTLLAYPGGLEEISATTEWSDLKHSMLRGKMESSKPASLDENDNAYLIFATLRALHAKQAEKIATQSFTQKDSEDKFYLIQNLELRQSLGMSIGRIAHSHHWDIDRVSDDLRDDIGPSPDLPDTWTLSERKVACMLRAADIAHIDRRRAPTILYARKALPPGSDVHWKFQNKINRPSYKDGALTYTSGENFSKSESEAWWMCHDMVRLIDSEIRSCNNLLDEIGQPIFQVSRVLGVESPRALAKYVTTEGWKPVSADVRVSDPISLAKSLGGSNLYGNDRIAPVRELIQNAIDAVRARRKYESRDSDWGSVKITIEKASNGSSWLFVDDNGIGMSERVLTGPLLDFGRSFWKSSLVRDEFPGLEAKGIEPIGKFGIGFFSVFLLGDAVRVSSKRFDSAASDAQTLEFNGLDARPILQKAKRDEIPLDMSSRVGVRLLDYSNLTGDIYESDYYGRTEDVPFSVAVKAMLSCVDVNIHFVDNISGDKFFLPADVWAREGREFLEDLYGGLNDSVRNAISQVYGERITNLMDESGKVYGRAALNLSKEVGFGEDVGRIAVGGLVYRSNRGRGTERYVGVMSGVTKVAARNAAQVNVGKNITGPWATRQAEIIDRRTLSLTAQMTVAHAVEYYGGSTSFPICFSPEGPLSIEELRSFVKRQKRIALPVSVTIPDEEDGEYEAVKHLSIDSVWSSLYGKELNSEVVIFSTSETDAFVEDPSIDELVNLVKTGSSLRIELENIWGGKMGEAINILRVIRGVWSKVSCTLEIHKIYKNELYIRQSQQVCLIFSPEQDG